MHAVRTALLVAVAAQPLQLPPLQPELLPPWGGVAFDWGLKSPVRGLILPKAGRNSNLDLQDTMWRESYEAAVRATNFERPLVRPGDGFASPERTKDAPQLGVLMEVPGVLQAVKSSGKSAGGSSSGAPVSASTGKQVQSGGITKDCGKGGDYCKCATCGKWIERRYMRRHSNSFPSHTFEEDDEGAAAEDGEPDNEQAVQTESAVKREEAYVIRRRSEAGAILNDLRYIRMVASTHIDAMKAGVQSLLESAKREILIKLTPLLKPGCEQEAQQVIGGCLDLFNGLQTEKQERSALKELLGGDKETSAWIKPSQRMLIDPDGKKSGDFVYDFPVDKLLKRLILNKPQLWQAIQASCAKLPVKKRSESSGPVPILSDIFEADAVYNHEQLGWRAESDGSQRLALGLYYDGLNCVNPLGAFAGLHTIGLFYIQIYNLPQDQRQSMPNVLPVCLAFEEDCKYYGMEQVISGYIRQGDQLIKEPYEKGTSIGASMRRLHDGISLRTPTTTGGYEPSVVRAWIITLSADFPAAGECCGTKKGTSSHAFCRLCNCMQGGYDTTDCPCGQIHTMHPAPCRWEGHEPGECQPCDIVDEVARWEIKEEWDAATEEQRKDLEQENGLDGRWLQHGFTGVPGVSPVFPASICPFDFMHTAPHGPLSHELAAFIFTSIRARQWFTYNEFRKAFDRYPWPKEQGKPPLPTEAFLTGRRIEGHSGFFPKPNIHFHWGAAETLHFAMHAEQFFKALLPRGKYEEDPIWKCLLLHLDIIHMMMQHAMPRSTVITVLAKKIHDWQKLFLSIVGYEDLYKLKGHWYSHFPSDILNFGPTRQYWCMRFEALNQFFKRIAMRGSYRDTLYRMAFFWMVRSGLNLKDPASKGWGDADILASADPSSITGTDVVEHLLNGNTAFGSLMADLFEVIHGISFDQVPPESFLAVEQVHRFSFLGKQYCDAGSQWILFCDSWSGSGVEGALINSIYKVNSVIYLCLATYGKMACEDRGRLYLEASRQSVPKVVALDDLMCINGMWCVHVDASSGKRTFIEWQ